MGRGQAAFVAVPEKALLDLVHLCPGGDQPSYLEELRLDLETLDMERLDVLAPRRGSAQAARYIRSLAEDRSLSYEAL